MKWAGKSRKSLTWIESGRTHGTSVQAESTDRATRVLAWGGVEICDIVGSPKCVQKINLRDPNQMMNSTKPWVWFVYSDVTGAISQRSSVG